MGGRAVYHFNRTDIVAMHARYWSGHATIASLGAEQDPPMGPTSLYWWFDRYGLPLRKTYHVAVLDVVRGDGLKPRQPVRMSEPPIYRSEFIRGVDVKRLVAGR